MKVHHPVADQLLTLRQVAERLQWSTRTLQRRLQDHGIPTIGRGRLARLTEGDVDRLIAREREVSAANLPPPEPPKHVSLARINASVMDERMRQYYRRRLGQLHRRKPGTK